MTDFKALLLSLFGRKIAKKLSQRNLHKEKRKRWWKEKKIRVNLVGKMITFFVLLSGTAEKCFYFAERKMERKLKMDVKCNFDEDE